MVCKKSQFALIKCNYEKPSLRTFNTVDAIIHAVCHHYDISMHKLFSKSRSQSLVDARYLAFYIMRNELHLSFPEIGLLIGGKHHSTIIHGCNVVKGQLSSKFRNGIKDAYFTIFNLNQ